MTPVSATVEPTERSMPLVRMTKVMPMPRMPYMATWRSTLRRLAGLRKNGEMNEAAMMSTISAPARPAPRGRFLSLSISAAPRSA